MEKRRVKGSVSSFMLIFSLLISAIPLFGNNIVIYGDLSDWRGPYCLYTWYTDSDNNLIEPCGGWPGMELSNDPIEVLFIDSKGYELGAIISNQYFETQSKNYYLSPDKPYTYSLYTPDCYASWWEIPALDETNGLYYYKDKDSVYIIGADNEVVSVPSEMYGKEVKLSDYAFAYSPIQKARIPEEFKELPQNLFYGSKIKNVNLPADIMSIPEGTFKDCIDLKEIAIPTSVTAIGSSAFEGCSSLMELTIPNTVTSIGSSAFYGCSGLTEITIPKSVTSIGANAFNGLELKDLTLVATEVPEISNCFSDSFNSATLNVPEEALVDYLLSSWNVFRNISDGKQVSTVATDNSLDYHIFKSTGSGEVRNEAILIPGNYGSLSSVDILDRITIDGERYYVTGIGYGAFADCKNLKSVNFNARTDVRTIGGSAFSGCSGLTEITIPNTVTAMGKYAFNKCGGLQKVNYSSLEHLCSIDFGGSRSSNPLWCAHNLYIGENKIEELVVPTTVKDIKAYAFAGGKFTSVTIPSSVTTIGKDAFADCTKITTVRFEDGISPLDLVADAFHYYKDNQTYYQYINDLYLGRSIANRTALWPKNLVIGNLVTEFYNFKGNANLESLTLGSGLTAIPADAFNGCSLSEVAVPVNVTEIGENAFANNNGKLSKVSMGYKLATVGEKAFDGNTIETVNVAAMTPPEAPDNVFSAYSGKLYVPAEKVYEYYDSWSCWSRFAGYPLVNLEKIEGSADKVSGQIGETVQLSVTLTPENLSLPYVFWRSTNPELAIVDNNGLVTIVGGYELGECKIIAETLYDTDKVATFDVKSLSTGIFEIVAEEGFDEFGGTDVERANDIFTLEGVCLKRNATKEDIDALAPGIYIVAGKKMVVK